MKAEDVLAVSPARMFYSRSQEKMSESKFTPSAVNRPKVVKLLVTECN